MLLTIVCQQTTTNVSGLTQWALLYYVFSIGEWAGFIWPRQGLGSFLGWYKICWMCPSSFLDQQHVLMEKGRNTKGVSKTYPSLLNIWVQTWSTVSSHISLVKASPMANPNIHGVKEHAPLMEMRRESKHTLINNLPHKNEVKIIYYLKLKLCLLLKDRSSSKEAWKLVSEIAQSFGVSVTRRNIQKDSQRTGIVVHHCWG